ncbi:MAG: ADP-ribosylglycohydrolase family protein, partial [Chryseolinea sp.]
MKEMLVLSQEVLRDKIKGGWAGQTIGVTFGGPTEFKYNGTMIQDYVPIKWYDGYLKNTMENNAGLYDDVYMDLTFVDVFEKKGLDAPVEEFANAYANAGYMLWHANQAGRYNILHGISAPQSGQWENNPHADCIDYQIESDFAGLMSPAMPNTASAISDKIGHIMNYGDGWYGGVYMGAMYTLAFNSNDIQYVVSEALKTIPEQSKFHKVISDVIQWHKQYPGDWKKTWFEIEKKWTEDISCPDGVFVPFNIDATVNSAYVVLGLLYGNGDFTKTLEISTRAGQDSDCNPSSAAGILGALLGYSKIPDYWKQG